MRLPRRVLALIHELKRRNVFAVVVAYTAAALVTLEAFSVIFPAVGLADWTVTVAVYVMIAGLPGVALVAWVYDLTPLGIIKTGPRRKERPLLTGPRTEAPSPHSIAVLPFVNMTNDSELEYFCDGLAEEITNALVHVEGVLVVARTSAFTFKGHNADVREMGRQLDVALVLEGSVRRHGPLLRITVQLIKTDDGYHLWSERYEERPEDVFSLQDDMAEAVVHRLRPKVGKAPAGLVRRGTENQAAYHEFLKGRHQWYARGLAKAAEHFSRAIALDPNYALAHAGLADACTYLGFYGFLPSRDAAERAQAAALRAVATQPDLADAHYSLGLVEFLFGWDVDAARSEFEFAASRNPGLALPQAQLCQLFAARRDAEQADAAAQRAIEREPLAPLVHATIGFANVFLQRYDRAVEACRRALAIDAHALPAVWVMATALTQMGRFDEAISMLEGAVEATGRNNFMLMWLGGALVQAGRADEAREILGELETRAAGGAPVLPAARAWIHAYLGETDAALDLLGEAIEERNTQVTFFIFFQVPGVHDDARFASLVAGTGLAEVLDLWAVGTEA